MNFMQAEEDDENKVFFQYWASFFIVTAGNVADAGQKFYENTAFGDQKK